MNGWVDPLLFGVMILDLSILVTSRVAQCVRVVALQGALVSVLPLLLLQHGPHPSLWHVGWMSLGSFAIKAVAVPWFLFRAIRVANVYREVEPFVGLHLSLLLGALLTGASFWLSTVLVLPDASAPRLLVPAAFATLLNGFLLLVSRKKAVTQVAGYLMLENGIFVFGQSLAHQLPFVVELGILLDLLGAIFVMGIVIHNISREFDHIDTERLDNLKG